MTNAAIGDNLLPGEQILWSGGPADGVLFFPRDALLIPFSVFWLGFAIFWESSVVALPNAPFFMKLWGVPFVAIGLHLVAGRFLFDAWLRRRTRYLFSNKRVLISRAAPFGVFVALNLRQLPQMSFTEGKDGRGTIRFGPTSSFFAANAGFSGLSPALDATPQFIAIDDVRERFNQIQQEAEKAQNSR